MAEPSIRIPITEPATLDPAIAADMVSIDLIGQLFEGLLGWDEKGEPVPLGAESWDVSADGLAYTFKLRPGVAWSDGRPVVAHDYEWAWKRVVDPKTGSDYASMLYPVKNAARIHREGLDVGQLGVTSPDDQTLVVTLEQQAAFFTRLVSSWTLVPVRQDVVEKRGYTWTDPGQVVTNGPFLLKEWQPGAQLVLERNGRYWGDKPALGWAVYRIFPEGADDRVFAAYQAGELDAFGSGAVFEVPDAQLERVLADPKLSQEVKTFAHSATMFIVANHRREHLRDPRVRIALGQAIERQQLLGDVLRRVGVPAFGLQPEGITGRQPDLWPMEDLAEAQKNLAAAGFPDGKGFPEITFTYDADPQWDLLASYLQRRFKDGLGITLRPQPMDGAAFLTWRGSDDWKSDGDLCRGGWISDYEDPHDWYNLLWDSREDAVLFGTGWQNEEFDKLVRQAKGELDRPKRLQLYERAERVLAAEYPSIPLFHYRLRTLVKRYVQHFEPQRVLGLVPLKRTRLERPRAAS